MWCKGGIVIKSQSAGARIWIYGLRETGIAGQREKARASGGHHVDQSQSAGAHMWTYGLRETGIAAGQRETGGFQGIHHTILFCAGSGTAGGL